MKKLFLSLFAVLSLVFLSDCICLCPNIMTGDWVYARCFPPGIGIVQMQQMQQSPQQPGQLPQTQVPPDTKDEKVLPMSF